MSGAGRLRIGATAAVAALGLGCAQTGAFAATATTPTLTVKIVPAVVKPKGHNKVYLTVTYDKKTTNRHPYLAAYIQFSSASCRHTAKAESKRSDTTLDFAGTVTNSPFLRWDSWNIGTLRGTRRVCAYLYAAKTDTQPLLTATATYRVL